MTVPVLFEIEQGEASGFTLRFCSSACRATHMQDGFAEGNEDLIDVPDGEICVNCCKSLH